MDKNTVWHDTETSPITLLENREWEQLSLYAKESTEFLIQKILAGDRNSLADSVTAGAIHMNIVEAAFSERFKEDKEKEAVFQTGRLMGILYAASQKLICEANREKAENVAREYLYDVKNLDAILLSLEENGKLSHVVSRLNEQGICIDMALLENYIEKMALCGFVRKRTFGKVHYILTDMGLNYIYAHQ